MTGDRPIRAVALGGGHGLHATLTALRTITRNGRPCAEIGRGGGGGW